MTLPYHLSLFVTLTTNICTKRYTFHSHVQLVPLSLGMGGIIHIIVQILKKITFLKQTLDFDGVLTTASRICKPCYSFHQQILLQAESGISTSMQTLHSIASDLDSTVKHFETQERNSASDKSFLAWNVSKICLQLVRTLQSEEAVLLPHLYAEFCQQVFQTIDMFPSVTKHLRQIHLQFDGF